MDILHIHRYLSKETSAEERKELELWLEQSEENRKLFRNYQKIYQVDIKHTHQFDVESALAKFKKLMDEDNSGFAQQAARGAKTSARKMHTVYERRKRKSIWLKVAATVIAGVLLSIYAITSTGLFEQEAEEIAEAETGLTVMTEAGEQKSFRLKDGSRIRLNASSSVYVHPGYGDRLRLVTLEGEAFFDVAENPDLEFVAQTHSARISVLGTSFGIRAWDDREESIVAVEEGRVSVRSSSPGIPDETILAAGEYSQIRAGEAPSPALQANFDQYLGWTNQMFVFEETPLKDVLHQLELHFNVRITVKDSTSINDPVTARYEGEALDEILRYTAITHEVEFEVEPIN